MKYDMLLLRLGELTLKGRNRSRFEKSVLLHVKSILVKYPNAQILKEYGRMYVVLNGESDTQVIDDLKKVFGISSISPVIKCASELDEIIKACEGFIEQLNLTRETLFKVNARRVWKAFPHPSLEMNHLIGSPLLKKFEHLSVSMTNPELELRIEIRETGTYIYCDVVPAVGGYPRGSNGKAMLLLSGGIDSPVAAWSAMRKGLGIECVHFYSYPYTSQLAKEKVIDLARVLSGFTGSIKLHLVPFTEVQTSFTGIGQDNLMITLMRRSMLRIATMLAEKEGAMALVTGDSLGQVASQTLSSMNVIGRATELPILRPLVMMDKNEIIEIARNIQTYELSILPYEDCCTLFVPKSPTTNPNLKIVEKVEESIATLADLIQDAVNRTETITLTPDSTPSSSSTDDTIDENWF